MKPILSLLFVSALTRLVAQTPHVVSVAPAGLTITAQPTGSISADFDVPLDPATVHAGSFKVFGRWSGPAAGSFTLENNNSTVRFTPNEPFFAGESVSVSLSKAIHAATGEGLEKGYAWGFGIRTLPGTLGQILIDEISLRLPGEGLLQTYGAYAGDLNNDGWSDLTAVNETADDLRILLNDGTGGYTTGFEVLPMGDESPSPSEGGDFNGDGEIDLVVTTAHTVGETRILFGDGQGSFSDPVVYATGEATRSVGVLDLEGDGDDDIVVVNRDDSNAKLLWNDGTGVFTVTGFNPPGNGETALVLSDANGDGTLDLFIGYYDSQQVSILLGDGAGNFTVSDTKPVSGRPWMIGVGDLNGDGRADVVSSNSTGHNATLLFGDGQGHLSSPVAYPLANGSFPLAIDLGDLDGDGDLDMVTSQYGGNNFAVFGNNGSGVLASPIYLPSAQNASCSILHDRDNDGDLDITGTDETADVIRLFENPGVSAAPERLDPALQMLATPNPCSDQTVLRYDPELGKALVFEVTDLAGRVLQRLPGNASGTCALDLASWAAGVYWVRVKGAPGALKLVKK